ncbi:hypothetical protein O6H91_09G091700 [Diphasiastrum complanatum]|uniref:Uncharacterized protein n=2 Tax=Diphasiastrum complanatum TaxID=34168 RepID=A0ACC2CRS6_DIPCM|nr:hypothetical protein O6H91_09G091700 [Diphasiastrum complanatum]KAJ7544755.1 hypothetical protein O6H91_09G091700 [Diphasiastrum complanatum]
MPYINGKLPQPLKLHPRRSRAHCFRASVLAALFVLLLIAASAYFIPTYSFVRNKRTSRGSVKVEDTYRSSAVWPSVTSHRQSALVNGSGETLEDELDGNIIQELFGDERQRFSSRPKVLGVVGIQTGFGSVERRKALRDTWMPNTPEGIFRLQQATGLAFRFVIGHTPDARQMAELEEEVNKYKDFIRIDVEEEYLKLPYKTLAYFKAVFQLFDADFYVKADDDIYLRPDRLATLLAKDRTTPRTYLGCMKKGPVVSDTNQKWYEPLGSILGQEYFLHAYGPIYALSSEVVVGLANIKNDSYRMFSNEDVTVGAWMLAMNVDHENNHALCEATCSSTSIAVWDIPKCSGLCNAAEKLRELHKDPTCSKTSTIPLDD